MVRYPLPRPETTRDILERGFAMCPELAPPEVRKQREPTLEDVLPLIIEEGCGLRPARKDGIRLEMEWFEAGKNTRVPVVFNYGYLAPPLFVSIHTYGLIGMAATDSSPPGVPQI